MAIEQERARKLCEYLQEELQLAPSFCKAVQSDPEFRSKLYEQLKSLHEKLRDALQDAYPEVDNLKEPIEQELDLSLGDIPDGKAYRDRLLEMIKLAAREGYLPELIAAAHKRNVGNPRLDLFVKKNLKPLIEEILPPAQRTNQAQPLQEYTIYPTHDSGIQVNGNKAKSADDGRVDGNEINVTSDIAAYASLEMDGILSPSPTPITSMLPAKSSSRPEDSITQANELIREARHKLQAAYDMFTSGEQIDEDTVIECVKEAKEKVKGICDVLSSVSAPSYPGLRNRLIGKREYFCQRADFIVLSMSKIKLQMLPFPRLEQEVKIELEGLLRKLQQSENLIGTFAQQVKQLDQTDEYLSGSDN